MKRWIEWYCTRPSIRSRLKVSYVTIIVIMAFPAFILLITMLSTNRQYNRLIANVDQASSLCEIVQTELKNELWDIVAGKKPFAEGNQYVYVEQVRKGLSELAELSKNQEKLRYIVAAQRANDTLETYIDKLRTQIESNMAVSYNESVYEEIRSVSELTASVLQKYITDETISIAALNQQIQITAGVIAALVTMILALMIWFAAKSFRSVEKAIHTPILNLEQMAVRIAGGDLTVRADTPHINELKRLTESLNLMAARLEQLIEERVEAQQTIQKYEMRALQAQITPHFVYNTFETIVWLAEEERNREVIDITLAFTDFFRISLSRGQDYVTVEREIQHVRSYLAIQSVRYGSIMSYTIDVDEELLPMCILKIVLQPLVENSIYHGIKGKRGRGTIQVEGKKNPDQTMTFQVMDNGQGMKPERLALVRQRLSSMNAPKDTGFGLFNVHKRLQLYYGGDGLHIESEYCKGTTICFTLPCQQSE